ncbi:MAG: hypothetical protein HYZ45_03630 [Burkholderiales bacterium]|nr:hypothetical protein [Burkholderiales bacterium]
MEHKLSLDEFDALEQVSTLKKGAKPSACVNRNAKRLSGIKLIAFRRDGGLELTDNGRQFLFIKQCLDGLRTLADGGSHSLPSAVAQFLARKSHIEAANEPGQWQITERGRESLAESASQA